MFIETIHIHHGKIQNLQGHIARMQQTANHFGFSAPDISLLESFVPAKEKKRVHVKCRLVYHNQIEEITFEEYVPRKIQSLQLIKASPDYSFKYADRTELNVFLSQKGDADEILIVRDGCITDTSFSNVVFRKGKEFYTPDTYLLNGTKRQLLLHQGFIREKPITVDSLCEFEEIWLINAMLDLTGSCQTTLPTSSIRR